MANIGQFKVGTEWTKLDEVTGYTFEANSSYTIQNKGGNALLVCEGASQPTEKEVGFVLGQNQAFGYTAKSGEYLWIKAFFGTTSFNVAEGV